MFFRDWTYSIFVPCCWCLFSESLMIIIKRCQPGPGLEQHCATHWLISVVRNEDQLQITATWKPGNTIIPLLYMEKSSTGRASPPKRKLTFYSRHWEEKLTHGPEGSLGQRQDWLQFAWAPRSLRNLQRISYVPVPVNELLSYNNYPVWNWIGTVSI